MPEDPLTVGTLGKGPVASTSLVNPIPPGTVYYIVLDCSTNNTYSYIASAKVTRKTYIGLATLTTIDEDRYVEYLFFFALILYTRGQIRDYLCVCAYIVQNRPSKVASNRFVNVKVRKTTQEKTKSFTVIAQLFRHRRCRRSRFSRITQEDSAGDSAKSTCGCSKHSKFVSRPRQAPATYFSRFISV